MGVIREFREMCCRLWFCCTESNYSELLVASSEHEQMHNAATATATRRTSFGNTFQTTNNRSKQVSTSSESHARVVRAGNRPRVRTRAGLNRIGRHGRSCRGRGKETDSDEEAEAKFKGTAASAGARGAPDEH